MCAFDISEVEVRALEQHVGGEVDVFLLREDGARETVALGPQFGALELVMRDHVEDLAVAVAEQNGHGRLAVLGFELLARKQHLDT